jgi:hypothetical protein
MFASEHWSSWRELHLPSRSRPVAPISWTSLFLPSTCFQSTIKRDSISKVNLTVHFFFGHRFRFPTTLALNLDHVEGLCLCRLVEKIVMCRKVYECKKRVSTGIQGWDTCACGPRRFALLSQKSLTPRASCPS